MNRIILSLFFSFCFLLACRDKVKTYENDLGIDPAVVAQIDTANYTTIEWMETVKDFGIAKEGDSVFVTFRFKNTGRGELYISEVLSSCGCTVADYPRHAVLPGESGEIKATFNSHGNTGFIHKEITVTTNTSNKIKQLPSFKGEVRDSLSLSR